MKKTLNLLSYIGGFTDDGAEYQKTYFLSRFPSITFSESRSFCNSYKMDLITIETAAESQEFLSILDAHSYLRPITGIQLWLDALTVTLKSKTEWFWTNTGNKISFPIEWMGTEPNDMGGSEYCLFIGKLSINAKFGYGDGNCLANSRFAICQNIDLMIP